MWLLPAPATTGSSVLCRAFFLLTIKARATEKLERPESSRDRNPRATEKLGRPESSFDRNPRSTKKLVRPESSLDRNPRSTGKRPFSTGKLLLIPSNSPFIFHRLGGCTTGPLPRLCTLACLPLSSPSPVPHHVLLAISNVIPLSPIWPPVPSPCLCLHRHT